MKKRFQKDAEEEVEEAQEEQGSVSTAMDILTGFSVTANSSENSNLNQEEPEKLNNIGENQTQSTEERRRQRLGDEDDNKNDQIPPEEASADEPLTQEEQNSLINDSDAKQALASEALEIQRQKDLKIAEFMKEAIQIEKARLKENGVKVEELTIKSTAIVKKALKKDKKNKTNRFEIVNRLEINSNFDFERVENVLVGPEVNCSALKADYCYVNLLLFAGKNIFLAPYCYNSTMKNMKSWTFVNNKGKETFMRIEFDE